MPPRRDKGGKGRRPRRDGPRGNPPRREGDRPHRRSGGRPPGDHRDRRRDPGSPTQQRREMLARGRAAEVGLDGRLRVDMEPVAIDVAARLSRGRGAQVFTPRGQGVGHVETIIGTLDRPIAVVRVHSDMRREASEMTGRELFIG